VSLRIEDIKGLAVAKQVTELVVAESAALSSA
jgi:hypothetical protein